MISTVVFLLIVFAVVGVVSFFLAKRSMQDFQESPEPSSSYGVFLVRTPRSVDEDFLRLLEHSFKDTIVAFELLFKGQERALVVYCPLKFEKRFPNLHLLELEDYSENVDTKNILAWEVEAKNKGVLGGVKRDASLEDFQFFKDLSLSSDEQVYFQVAAKPFDTKLVKDPDSFQVNIRVVVVSSDLQKRAKIAKHIDQTIRGKGQLVRKKKPNPSSKIYKEYRKRNFIPREVQEFQLSPEQLVAILRG